MTLRSKTIVTLLLISVVGAGITACGHKHRGPEQRAEWMMNRVSDKLDLNEEQQNKLRAVKDELLVAYKKHHEEQAEMFDRLIDDVKKPNMDKQLLLQIAEKRQKAFAKVTPSVIDRIVEFHDSLNDEQRAEAAEKLKHFREHFKKHHDS